MCDVPSMAVFCRECIEFCPGIVVVVTIIIIIITTTILYKKNCSTRNATHHKESATIGA
jgi:heterodisulfide reductase subunit C